MDASVHDRSVQTLSESHIAQRCITVYVANDNRCMILTAQFREIEINYSTYESMYVCMYCHEITILYLFLLWNWDILITMKNILESQES